MNTAIAIAAEATTSVNPGVSSAGASSIPAWKSSLQEESSIGNSTYPFAPNCIPNAAGLPFKTRPPKSVVLSPLTFIVTSTIGLSLVESQTASSSVIVYENTIFFQFPATQDCSVC